MTSAIRLRIGFFSIVQNPILNVGKKIFGFPNNSIHSSIDQWPLHNETVVRVIHCSPVWLPPGSELWIRRV